MKKQQSPVSFEIIFELQLTISWDFSLLNYLTNEVDIFDKRKIRVSNVITFNC